MQAGGPDPGRPNVTALLEDRSDTARKLEATVLVEKRLIGEAAAWIASNKEAEIAKMLGQSREARDAYLGAIEVLEQARAEITEAERCIMWIGDEHLVSPFSAEALPFHAENIHGYAALLEALHADAEREFVRPGVPAALLGVKVAAPTTAPAPPRRKSSGQIAVVM
jgi:hypothetical protein